MYSPLSPRQPPHYYFFFSEDGTVIVPVAHTKKPGIILYNPLFLKA